MHTFLHAADAYLKNDPHASRPHAHDNEDGDRMRPIKRGIGLRNLPNLVLVMGDSLRDQLGSGARAMSNWDEGDYHTNLHHLAAQCLLRNILGSVLQRRL